MLKTLNFVKNAIEKNSTIYSHFEIKNKTIKASNSTFTLCCPIDLDIDCKPKAVDFVKAIQKCEDVIALALTKAGRLSIKSKKLKVYIDCLVDEMSDIQPTGARTEVDGAALLDALRTVLPIISDDLMRPWATGALIRNGSVYATNNALLVECWTGCQLPDVVNIPRAAVRELVRIGEPITAVQTDGSSTTLHLSDDSWLKTRLLPADWPDLSRIFDRINSPQPIRPDFFEAVETILPFAEIDKIILDGNIIKTHNEANSGASFDLEDFNQSGCYNGKLLLLLKGIAKKIDFKTEPALFFGDKLRGAISSMRIE